MQTPFTVSLLFLAQGCASDGAVTAFRKSMEHAVEYHKHISVTFLYQSKRFTKTVEALSENRRRWVFRGEGGCTIEFITDGRDHVVDASYISDPDFCRLHGSSGW